MFKNITSDDLIEIAIHIGVVLLILLVTVLVAKLIRRIMSRKEWMIGMDKTQFKFLSHLLKGFIYFIGITTAIYSIPSLRGLSTSIFAGSGIIAIIIGFASQQAFSNIVGGIFIAIFKPFRLGDRLKFVDQQFIGIVEDITLRHTVIQTFDNKRIIVPNSVISSAVLENANIIDQKTTKYFDIGISYDSDVDKAMEIIRQEVLKHPSFLDNRTEEEIVENKEQVKIRLLEFGESSVILRAWVTTKDPVAAFNIGCDLNKSVKKRFDNEGIEIPFPYRTIVFKSQDPPKVIPGGNSAASITGGQKDPEELNTGSD